MVLLLNFGKKDFLLLIFLINRLFWKKREIFNYWFQLEISINIRLKSKMEKIYFNFESFLKW